MKIQVVRDNYNNLFEVEQYDWYIKYNVSSNLVLLFVLLKQPSFLDYFCWKICISLVVSCFISTGC